MMDMCKSFNFLTKSTRLLTNRKMGFILICATNFAHLANIFAFNHMKKKIYSEKSWKMEHFLFLRHILNRCSFRDNCVWICVQALRCNTQTFLNFCIDFLNFHKMNIVAIFYIAKWDQPNGTKIIQFEHCFGLLKRKHESKFSFQ